MKIDVIKPNKDNNNESSGDSKSILMPVLYLILGIILAFKSNEAIQILFYIIGILVIVYGIKTLITYYQNKESAHYKNINISVAIASIIIGILLLVFSEELEVSIRYVLGFFLIYMGVSRLLTQISFGDFKNLSTLSNIVLIIMGVYSIFVSNAVFVIIGWILIANSALLFWEYFRK